VFLSTQLLGFQQGTPGQASSCRELAQLTKKNLELLAQLEPLTNLVDLEKSPIHIYACNSEDDRNSEAGTTDPAPVTRIFFSSSQHTNALVGRELAVAELSDGVASTLPQMEVVGGITAPSPSPWQEPVAEDPFSAEDPIQAESEQAEQLLSGETMRMEGEAEGGELEQEGGEAGEEEGEEGEEIEYSEVDVGVGGMLLGSVAFVMLLFYFVNWQDDDIRRYSWSIISTTVSIFTSVLMFHGINEAIVAFLEEFLGMGGNGYFYLLISYTFFLCWFALMQVVIAYETGSLGAYAPADLNEETWCIANAMRWDYGHAIDPKFVRTQTAAKSIADINDTELFVMKRKTKLDQMQTKTLAMRTLFSHMTGFACIHAGGELQHIPFFAQSPSMVLLATVCNRFFLLTLFKLTESHDMPRRAYTACKEEEATEDPHFMCADLCREEVQEAENDVASLATSYLLVMAMRYSLTGVLPNAEGLEEPPIEITYQCILSLYGCGVGCMIVVILLLHSGLPGKFRQAMVFQNTMGMSLSWCIFWATRWLAAGSKTLEELRMDPETMEGRILLALLLSGIALGVIFFLDHIADSAGDASETSNIIQNFINALSILVGFSWEHCFDFALEAVASKTSNPNLMKLMFTGAVAVVITPAWRNYILVKVIQLNRLQSEESAASSKKTFQSSASTTPAPEALQEMS